MLNSERLLALLAPATLKMSLGMISEIFGDGSRGALFFRDFTSSPRHKPRDEGARPVARRNNAPRAKARWQLRRGELTVPRAGERRDHFEIEYLFWAVAEIPL
jgi:hypothetical protein